ncbi:Gfo/Idh/MocA family protein [Actinoplanes sp. CA-142083]|uniref:Gfo/Idh/MocA family protein n=1 Tax=Actinoplanes sp. CA-142083 TaxID=3239903 RepID=UPI003D8BAF9C
MTDDIIRVGVLGAARIAPMALIRPARDSAAVTVAAVAARDPARARRFAAKHGIATVHTSYEDLIADPGIDAVYNPLPNGLHGRWTIAAIRAGKHVLCEKPFTANADEARAVQDAAEGTGLVVMEAFHYRYHPVARRMVEIARSGELGQLRHVEARFAAPIPPASDIRYRLDLAGGALMDIGAYSVHMIRALAGAEPEKVVSARALLRGTGIDRAMRADLLFPDGATGKILASLWSSQLLRLSVRAVGDHGELRVFNPLTPQLGHRITVRPRYGRRRIEHLSRRSSYAYQLDAFAAAVRDGAPVLTDAADAIRTMTVIDAIYQAAGLPVRQPS